MCLCVCGGVGWSSLLSSCRRGAFINAPPLNPSERFAKDICSSSKEETGFVCTFHKHHFWD